MPPLAKMSLTEGKRHQFSRHDFGSVHAGKALVLGGYFVGNLTERDDAAEFAARIQHPD